MSVLLRGEPSHTDPVIHHLQDRSVQCSLPGNKSEGCMEVLADATACLLHNKKAYYMSPVYTILAPCLNLDPAEGSRSLFSNPLMG